MIFLLYDLTFLQSEITLNHDIELLDITDDEEEDDERINIRNQFPCEIGSSSEPLTYTQVIVGIIFGFIYFGLLICSYKHFNSNSKHYYLVMQRNHFQKNGYNNISISIKLIHFIMV